MRKFLFLLVTLVFITGCGEKEVVDKSGITITKNENLAAEKANNSPKGYLLVEKTNVLFVHWTEVDKKLNGQLQVFLTQGSGKQRNESSTHSFTGILDKENISINFSGSIWIDQLSGQTWTGTLNSKKLTLIIPSKDGNLATAVFDAATVEDYNQVVNQIKTNVSNYNKRLDEEQIAEQTQRAETERIAKQQNEVSTANKRLDQSIKRVSEFIKINADKSKLQDEVIQSYNNHLIRMQNMYETLKNNASRSPLTSAQIGIVEGNLGSLEAAYGAIEADNNRMSVASGTIERYIATLQEIQETVKNNWTLLQNSVASNSSGIPKAQFVEEDVNKAVATAQQEIEKIESISTTRNKEAIDIGNNAVALLKSAIEFVGTLQPTSQN